MKLIEWVRRIFKMDIDEEVVEEMDQNEEETEKLNVEPEIKKAQPTYVQPAIQYHPAFDFLTDRQIELYLVQHRLMVDFLLENGLDKKYNEYQNSKKHSIGYYNDFRKRWFGHDDDEVKFEQDEARNVE